MTRTIACLLALLVWCSVPAGAHPAPFSFLDVRVEPDAVDVTVVVHVLDIAHELKVPESALLDPSVLAPHTRAVVDLIRERLRLAVDRADLVDGSWSAPEPVPDRHALRLRSGTRRAAPPGSLPSPLSCFPTTRCIRPSSTSTSASP